MVSKRKICCRLWRYKHFPSHSSTSFNHAVCHVLHLPHSVENNPLKCKSNLLPLLQSWPPMAPLRPSIFCLQLAALYPSHRRDRYLAYSERFSSSSRKDPYSTRKHKLPRNYEKCNRQIHPMHAWTVRNDMESINSEKLQDVPVTNDSTSPHTHFWVRFHVVAGFLERRVKIIISYVGRSWKIGLQNFECQWEVVPVEKWSLSCAG